MDDPIQYINANRAKYTREAISSQLRDAGHDRETIARAWEASDAATQAALDVAGARQPYGRFAAVLLLIGAIPVFLAGSLGGGFAFLWGAFYVATAAIVIGVGIVMTRLASGSAWPIVAVLSGIVAAGVVWGMVTQANAFTDSVLWVVASVAAVGATVVSAILHRYRTGYPVLAYALPALLWLVPTGMCISPFFTPGA